MTFFEFRSHREDATATKETVEDPSVECSENRKARGAEMVIVSEYR